jgi:NifB/MoaA-like Fe-S oxidoreductase
MFLLAGVPVPPAPYYDDWPLTENGVGAVRAFLDDADRAVGESWPLAGRRVGVVTGTRMAEVMAPVVSRLATATGARIELIPVENTVFGPTVTTAGLLGGTDVLAAVRAVEDRRGLDVVLLPAESLNDDDVFIDSLPLAALRVAVAAEVIPAHSLRSALEQL